MPGVYLSYPFCAQKCTYCNFASGVFPQEREGRYLAALEREIRGHRWEWRPETVYLGGGTPSNLAPEALRALLEAIPGRPWLEATMEAAPGSITAEKARAWASLGIGRVSLGVQSFVEAEIRRTGRKHTAETVVREMQILSQQGIVNCNLDLIAGLPGQTARTWRESLDWIERLEPAHVSVYMLEVDEDSRLGKEILRGGSRYGAAEIPTDDRIADFYEEAVERLAGLGIRRYEISNFARPGFESRHNLKYWKLQPYVGFGADAHSFDGRVRRQNPETVEEYLSGDRPLRSGWQAGRPPGPPAPPALQVPRQQGGTGASACQPAPLHLLAGSLLDPPAPPALQVLRQQSGSGGAPSGPACQPVPSHLSALSPLSPAPKAGPDRQEAAGAALPEPADPGERFYVGLRLMEGIRPTAEDWARFDGPIRRFVEAGLLESTAGALRLTGRGVLLSNEVFQEFLTV
ncbi:MAG: radical SAM family heme chaperone HemW [Bryobacteraceae bacterium]